MSILEGADSWAMESNDQAILDNALRSFKELGFAWGRLFRIQRTTRGVYLRGVSQFGEEMITDPSERGRFVNEFKGSFLIETSEEGSGLSTYLQSLLSLDRPTLISYVLEEPPGVEITQSGLLQAGTTGNNRWPHYMNHFQSDQWIEAPIRNYFGPVGLLSLPKLPTATSREEFAALEHIHRAFCAPMLWNLEREEKQEVLFRAFKHDLTIWDIEPRLASALRQLEDVDDPILLGIKSDIEEARQRFLIRQEQLDRLKRIAATMTRPKTNEAIHYIELAFLGRSIIPLLEQSYQRQIAYAPSRPDALVVIDGGILEFVLAQMCDNSLKHHATQIILRDSFAGDYLRLHVHDNGWGIDKKQRVYDLGEKDVPSTSGGMGISLVACNYFLSHFGARLYAEPDQPRDGGALFTIELQLAQKSGEPRHE
jgi:signal transduction histidine kinase